MIGISLDIPEVACRGGQVIAPAFVPKLVSGQSASIFADFTTEGGTNHYWGNNVQSGSFAAWLASLGGTFTRSGTAPMFQGGVVVNASTGVARFPTTSGVVTGLRVGPTQTELCLWNRDLTNVVWTPTLMTVAKDQTGIDGAATSCSSLTVAASTTGQILQSITDAVSTRRSTAVWIRLISGSGTVNITRNGGTTWTSLGAIPGSFTQIPLNDTLAPVASTNPTVGLQIVAGAGGMAVAVDAFSHRQSVSSSVMNIADPIFTTSATVAVNGERILFPLNQTTLSALIYQQNAVFAAGGNGAPCGGDSSPPWDIAAGSSTAFQEFNGSATLAASTVVNLANTNKVMVTGSPSARAICVNNGTVNSAATALIAQAFSNFVIGGGGTSVSNNMGGDLMRLAIWPNATTTNADLGTLTT